MKKEKKYLYLQLEIYVLSMETTLIIIGAILLILLLSLTGYLFKILGYILEFIMGGVSNFFGCIFRLIMTLIIGYIIISVCIGLL